jgi:uncharacterized membrane protein YccC
MSDIVYYPLLHRALSRLAQLGEDLSGALGRAGPSLLFALRLWVSVCFALYVAFWLELDKPFWAGASAAIVCQPQLGASLRKGSFRLIGTIVGAVMIVVLTGCFPQDRFAFLGLLAVWGGLCAFGATVLRNFASYAAALAGYTAVIIAADTLGATGGASPDVFWVAVYRASEISIGIVCAGIVLAGTDLGGAQRRLAGSFATIAAEITAQFTRMLAMTRHQVPDTRAQRRELVRRVIALDPTIDQAIGESSQLRYDTPLLQTAHYGLFTALCAWRGVAAHLPAFSAVRARHEADAILRSIPAELRSMSEPAAASDWIYDPMALHRVCEQAVQTLLALPAGTPVRRLLADETAKLLAGMLHVIDAVALLVDVPGRPHLRHLRFRLSIPDWLPALVNAGRAVVAIAAVELFWVVTAWPGGAQAIVFVAIILLLLSPKGEQAYAAAMALTLGIAANIFLTAMIKFAVLPAFDSFPAFCLGIGLLLIPAGFGLAHSRNPIAGAVFTALLLTFVPLLAPTNEMTYNTAQYYNGALVIFAGCSAALLSFRLLPPLSPTVRTRRLLVLTLRDLRRLALEPRSFALGNWEARLFGRLAALPDAAEPVQRAELLAAFSAGTAIIQLSGISHVLDLGPELDVALAAVAHGDTAMARTWLASLDQQLASHIGPEPEIDKALRARASILVVSEVLAQHAGFFDSGARR